MVVVWGYENIILHYFYVTSYKFSEIITIKIIQWKHY